MCFVITKHNHGWIVFCNKVEYSCPRRSCRELEVFIVLGLEHRHGPAQWRRKQEGCRGGAGEAHVVLKAIHYTLAYCASSAALHSRRGVPRNSTLVETQGDMRIVLCTPCSDDDLCAAASATAGSSSSRMGAPASKRSYRYGQIETAQQALVGSRTGLLSAKSKGVMRTGSKIVVAGVAFG